MFYYILFFFIYEIFEIFFLLYQAILWKLWNSFFWHLNPKKSVFSAEEYDNKTPINLFRVKKFISLKRKLIFVDWRLASEEKYNTFLCTFFCLFIARTVQAIPTKKPQKIIIILFRTVIISLLHYKIENTI